MILPNIPKKVINSLALNHTVYAKNNSQSRKLKFTARKRNSREQTARSKTKQHRETRNRTGTEQWRCASTNNDVHSNTLPRGN